MKSLLFFFSTLSVVFARPGYLTAPLTLSLNPFAPVGPDGRVLDTPEVAIAKAEHAAAHVNERNTLSNEAIRSFQADQTVPTLLNGNLLVSRILLAPIGADGKVVDTPEVTVAKAAHAAAHVNERINLANEAIRSSATADVAGNVGIVSTAVPLVGLDGRVVDTPEVAAAKAAHVAAHINEKINLANEAARNGGVQTVIPQVLGTSIVLGAPLGPDGRLVDTPQVAVAKAAHVAAHINEKIHLENEAVKSADVVAVAGPAVAYGRLIY